MPVASPASSSTNSKPARRGSAEAASQAAQAAFASPSTLSLDQRSQATVPASQEGRRRLTDSYLIRRDLIVPDPDQPRKSFDEQGMKELTASIRSRGIKQPLTVRWSADLSRYMVIDGGRRFEAASQLQIEELPCLIQKGDSKEVLIDQIVHNWQRVDLHPYETADALIRLRDEFGLNGQQIADVTGKPKGEISKLIAINDRVVSEVQDMARADSAGKLTKRHLYNISKLAPDEQHEVAEQVVSKGMTAIATERLANSKSKKASVANKARGISARQKRFHTSKADVVMTFRKAKFSDEDVRTVLDEMRREFEQAA